MIATYYENINNAVGLHVFYLMLMLQPMKVTLQL